MYYVAAMKGASGYGQNASSQRPTSTSMDTGSTKSDNSWNGMGSIAAKHS